MNAIKYFFIAGLISMMFISCNNEKADSGADNNDTIAKIYPVKTHIIKEQSITKTLEYAASLTAFKEIYFATASPGRINKIHVEVGSKVTKNQLLVEMDKTQLNQALTQYENAKSNFLRIDTLYQTGSISEQQYELAKTQYELAQSSVSFLKENTTLVSPIDGIVTGKYFENGEIYSGAPNTMAGKAAIITLMQINPLKAVVSISQSYFPKLKNGMKVSITTDIYPDRKFEGRIYKIHPTIDPATRTFKVEITVDNDDELLRPGMYASIELEIGETTSLVVPAIAILKQEGTNNRFVFINENGVAKQVEVKIGKRFDDMVELKTNHINAGSELIVDGQANLLNGSKINVVK